MIYLDNAATSWPKPEQVYIAVYLFMKQWCANPGRSAHLMGRMSAETVMKTRDALAALFNIENPLNIAFTANATRLSTWPYRESCAPETTWSPQPWNTIRC